MAKRKSTNSIATLLICIFLAGPIFVIGSSAYTSYQEHLHRLKYAKAQQKFDEETYARLVDQTKQYVWKPLSLNPKYFPITFDYPTGTEVVATSSADKNGGQFYVFFGDTQRVTDIGSHITAEFTSKKSPYWDHASFEDLVSWESSSTNEHSTVEEQHLQTDGMNTVMFIRRQLDPKWGVNSIKVIVDTSMGPVTLNFQENYPDTIKAKVDKMMFLQLLKTVKQNL